MKQSNTLPEKEYVVSSLTARWLDCIRAGQSLYARAFTLASEQYGEDDEAIQKPLLDAFQSLQEQMLGLMNGSVIENLGTLDNIARERVQI